jgi:hypothetical protein
MVEINRPCCAALFFTFGKGEPLCLAVQVQKGEDKSEDEENETKDKDQPFFIHLTLFY